SDIPGAVGTGPSEGITALTPFEDNAMRKQCEVEVHLQRIIIVGTNDLDTTRNITDSLGFDHLPRGVIDKFQRFNAIPIQVQGEVHSGRSGSSRMKRIG